MSLRVGVIGTGMIGQDHLTRLTKVLSNVDVTAVSDIDKARAVSAAPANAEVFEKAQDLINSSSVDAVVLCSWGPAHEEQLLECIKAGKPVFCEKPMVTSGESALRVMNAEVEFGSRLIQVGFMRRFDADYRRLKAVIDKGTIGTPLMYHSVHRNASVPEGLYTSEMPLNDTLVHDADIARWLLTDEISGVEVRAPRRSSHGRELRDPVIVLLHMASGVIVDVEISVNINYGYDIRGEVSCESGVASLPERPSAVIRDKHGVRQSVPEDWRERFSDAYDQEFREWVVAASAGGATGPNAWDGYVSTLAGEAALRAAETGGLESLSLVERPSLYEA